MKNPIERFQAKMSEPNENGCVLWIGWKNHNGYGKFSLNKRYKLAHRYAYELAYGVIPNGMCVCHTCDVRSCVNIDHLFLGTHLDNMKDMIAKGRSAGKPGVRLDYDNRGSRHVFAKLNEIQVKDIKIKLKNGIKGTVIAREYNVVDQTIYEIKNGKNWKHVLI